VQQDQRDTHSGVQANSDDDVRGRERLPPPLGERPSVVVLAGAAAALAAVGTAAFSALSSQPQLPPLNEVLGPAATVVLGGPPLALLAAKAVLRDKFHVELHR
jgi:hypothetical protein